MNNTNKLELINGIRLKVSQKNEDHYELLISNKSGGALYSDGFHGEGECGLTTHCYFPARYSVNKNGKVLLSGDTFLDEDSTFVVVMSNGLGDNLAGIGYLEDFRKLHQCNIKCYTYYASLFKQSFPEIEFLEMPKLKAGEVFNFSLKAPYKFLLQAYQTPFPNWRTVPLQKVMTDQLGMDYYYRKLNLKIEGEIRPKNRYVCISTGSTLYCKEWQYETGWGEVCECLIENGYTVIDCCQNPAVEIEGVTQWKDKTIYETAQLIKNCDFFIGLSSGISWLAWSLNRPVFMISGFSDEFHEFPCFRIQNKSVCHGCFHDTSFEYNTKDPEWCPRSKNFECTKEITPEMVIDRIKKEMKL